MTQCGWSGVGQDGGGVEGTKQVKSVDVGVGVVGGAERFRLGARVMGWSVGLWWLLVPGFVCGEAASPTPVASTTRTNPTPEGKISLEATARKRVPNKAADVVLAIQVDGRTGEAVSSALSQRSQTLLDYLRQQAVERLTTEDVGFEPQVEPGRGGPDRIVGYTGHASVSFRTTPDKLGTVLSGSLEHVSTSENVTPVT